jgi:predicted alpha/beta hydrolase
MERSTGESWPARDAYLLATTTFEPDERATATVLIAGAAAVPARFYGRFARYLAAQDLRVITFDYRGIGESRTGGLRPFKTCMQDWATLDLAGMIDQVMQRYPDSPLVVVAHSAGGQLVALADNNERIKALLLVAAQSGYWRHWRGPQRFLLMALWYGVMPVLTRIFGYFPARRLGLGEDLPAGVAEEWSRWCRHPNYFVDRKGRPLQLHLNGFHRPVLSYSIEDDWMAPAAAVDALMENFNQAQKQRRHLVPTALGVRRLGHFGLFRDSARAGLWPDVVRWISDHS